MIETRIRVMIIMLDALSSFRRCGLNTYIYSMSVKIPEVEPCQGCEDISETMKTNEKSPKGTLMRESLRKFEKGGR